MNVSVVVISGVVQDRSQTFRVGDPISLDEAEAARLIKLGVVALAAPAEPADEVNDQGGAVPPPVAPPAPSPAPEQPFIKSTSFRNPLRRNR